MKIAIGCDHVGLILKPEIIRHLQERGIEVIDKGTNSPERTDYPRYAQPVADAVAGHDVDLGILICGSGIGISIAANKVPASVRWYAVNPTLQNYPASTITPIFWPSGHAWSAAS